MEQVRSFFQQMAQMQWSDYLDILLVAYLIYRLIPLVRSTNVMRIVRVVVIMFVVSWLTEARHMYTTHYLISKFMEVGLIALVILFQPELRRALERLGNVRFSTLFGMIEEKQNMDTVISQTVNACEVMSRQKIGALIVFARNTPLDEFMKTGTAIDGQVSDQLIRNIFFPKAALHDGAMIIGGDRIQAAGCVLPLSESQHLSADLGTRHRAGVGMSEATDAVVVIVSEETGTISVALEGMLKRHLAPQTLEKLLRQELTPEQASEKEKPLQRLRQKVYGKVKGDDDEE